MRRYCQHLLQKLSNNGGVNAATEQIKAKQYAEPFKADKRKVIALAIELDDKGKEWQIGRKYKRRLEGNIKKNKEGNRKSPRCHTHRELFLCTKQQRCCLVGVR